MMKRLLTVLVFALLFPWPAQAVDSPTCVGQYYSFILQARSSETRDTYIKDLANPNSCQVADSLLLYEQLQTIRNAYRDAALVCGSTSQYQSAYHETLMELYLVRNLKDFESLYEEMRELFVVQEQRVDEDTLQQYFGVWEDRYADKVEDYKFCEEGNLGQLRSLEQDFQDQRSELESTITDLSISVGERRPLRDRGQARSDIQGYSLIQLYEAYQAKKAEREADTQGETLSEIINSEGGSSFIGAVDRFAQDDAQTDLAVLSAERLARYEQLYGEGSALLSSDLQVVTQEINATLIELNTNQLPTLNLGLSQVYDLQCR